MKSLMNVAPYLFSDRTPSGMTVDNVADLCRLRASGYLPEISQVTPAEVATHKHPQQIDAGEHQRALVTLGNPEVSFSYRVARGPWSSQCFVLAMTDSRVSIAEGVFLAVENGQPLFSNSGRYLARIIAVLLENGQPECLALAWSLLCQRASFLDGDFS